MVLSFTENFERANFTPMEEARFFAKALGLNGSIEPFGHNTNKVQALSKEIPSSPSTIEKRLYLLTLPETVQNMVESNIFSFLIGFTLGVGYGVTIMN